MYSSKLECFGCGVYAIVVFGDDHVTGHTGVDDISSDVAEAQSQSGASCGDDFNELISVVCTFL